MYALLAHKRTTPEDDRIEVAFSIRQMTCYNGFNTLNAFAIHLNEVSLLVRCTPSGDFFPGEVDMPVLSQVANRGGYGHWECLGIGWFDYYMHTGTDIPACMRTSPKIHNPALAKLVNYESCKFGMRFTDGSIQSRNLRVMTPNERLMAGIFNHYDTNLRVGEWGQTTGMGRFKSALVTQRITNYMTFDMVGSERPSGLAVAYLQVFRNISQESMRGWTEYKGMLSLVPHLLVALNARSIGANGTVTEVPGLKSIIPLLSVLYNNGSDSDIFSFAGPNVCAYLCTHGIWGAGPVSLWRRSCSMIEEGRYDKGQQSATLTENFNEAIRNRRRESGNAEFWPTSGANPFAGIKGSTSSATALETLMTMNQVNLRSNRDNVTRNQYLEQLANSIRSYWSSNPAQLLNDLCIKLARLPDITASLRPARTTPELATDGAAQGFAQWVATSTLH